MVFESIQIIFECYSYSIQITFKLYSDGIQIVLKLYSNYIRTVFERYSRGIRTVFERVFWIIFEHRRIRRISASSENQFPVFGYFTEEARRCRAFAGAFLRPPVCGLVKFPVRSHPCNVDAATRLNDGVRASVW